MADVQLAAKAVPDYAIHHLIRYEGRSVLERRDGARGNDGRRRFVGIDIAPGELGSLLPGGGWAIVDGADRVPTVGRVFWVVINGDPMAMRCLTLTPLSFVAVSEGNAEPAVTAGGAVWAVLGRVTSYGSGIDDAELGK